MENDRHRISEDLKNKERKEKQNDKEREVNIFYEPIVSLKSTILMHPKLQTLVIFGQPEIISAEKISELKGLKELWIVECCLKDLSVGQDATALKKNVKLEKLYLYSNDIQQIPDMSCCKRLRILSLARNKISDIQKLQEMPQLRDLNLADNDIKSIPNIFSATSELLHINLSRNPLHRLQDVDNLSALTRVQSLEFGDPVYGECPMVSLCNYRPQLIRRLTSLREIDYHLIGSEERNNSFNNGLAFYNQMRHQYLDNRSLNSTIISTMFSRDEFDQITHLTVSKCFIQEVNLADISLPHLQSLDLSNNQMSSLRGLKIFQNLHTLCLSHNQLGRHKDSKKISSTDTDVPEFPKLLVLHADHNKISSIVDLGFSKTSPLKYLFLQHNKIRDINGIEKFPKLNTAVLDHNRIENIAEYQFRANKNIRTLLIEKNKLTSLSFAKQLLKIEKLFVANNKITDKNQLERLGVLSNLREFTILGNPLCKCCNQYTEICEIVKSIKLIDGHSVLMDNSSVIQQV